MLVSDDAYPRVYFRRGGGLWYLVRMPREQPICLSSPYGFQQGTLPFWSGDFQTESQLTAEAVLQEQAPKDYLEDCRDLLKTQLSRVSLWANSRGGSR